jgi:heme/copper-type cytochrome/quinol oxidase subunit 1
MDLVAMGESGLKGWRRKAAEPVARAVSKRTSYTEAQVRAAIGAVFLALAVVAFARTLAMTIRAGRVGSQAG